MKHNYFSFKLYKEALSQLSLPGFLSAGILLAAVLLQGWSEIVHSFSRSEFSTWTPSIAEAWIPTMLYVWTAPFLFGLLLFNFLNSRKKSDYYHALTARRETLILSFAAAIYTWLIATVALALALGAMLFSFAGAELTGTQLSSAVLSFFPSILYAVAVTLLAMSLSGTLFTNLVLGNLLLWMPLLVSSLFSEGVSSLVPALPYGEASFFGLSLGVTLFGDMLLVTEFTWGGEWTFASGLANAAWTIFLAVAMFAAAVFFFVRRKSEMAGNSASSSRMQALYRVAVALPPLMVAAVFAPLDILRFGGGSPQAGIENAFAVVATMIIALLLIATFELISTKTWRNLLKVPLSFGIALLLAIVFAGFVWAVAAYEANFTPRAENIVWVGIPKDFDTNRWHINSATSRGLKSPDVNEPWRGDEALRTIFNDELRISDEYLAQAMAAALVEVRDEVAWIPTGSNARSTETPTSSYWSTDSSKLRNESLVFEIRTTSGMTKRRTLTYAETGTLAGTDRSNDRFIVPNQLGEAIANLDLR